MFVLWENIKKMCFISQRNYINSVESPGHTSQVTSIGTAKLVMPSADADAEVC